MACNKSLDFSLEGLKFAVCHHRMFLSLKNDHAWLYKQQADYVISNMSFCSSLQIGDVRISYSYAGLSGPQNYHAGPPETVSLILYRIQQLF